MLPALYNLSTVEASYAQFYTQYALAKKTNWNYYERVTHQFVSRKKYAKQIKTEADENKATPVLNFTGRGLFVPTIFPGPSRHVPHGSLWTTCEG